VVLVVIFKDGRFKAKFVGREREFALLKSYVEDTINGKGRLVLIEGETGIGKTRLLEEISQWAGEKRVRILSGKCLYHETATPYLPFIDAIRGFYQSTKTRETIPPKLEDMFRKVLPLISGEATAVEGIEVSPEGAEATSEPTSEHLRMGLIPMAIGPEAEEITTPTFARKPSTAIDVEFERGRMFETISQLIITIAEDLPLIILLDDLHWADNPSLQLLQYVARKMTEYPVLIYGTYRLEDLHEVEGKPHPLLEAIRRMGREKLFVKIVLNRLSYRHTCEMIDSIFEQPNIPKSFMKFIYTKTDGNPFFIEEVLRTLIEDGTIDIADKSWHTKLVLSDLRIPDTISDIITRRINRLDDDSIKILTYASLIGKEFHYSILSRIVEMPDEKILDCLDKIIAARLIRESPLTEEEEYRFDNMMIRDVAATRLSRSRKRLVHLKIGEAIESIHKHNLKPVIYDLAHHYYEGKEYGKASTYLIKAGEHATQMYAIDEALKYFKQALSVVSNLPDGIDTTRKRLEIATNLGYNYMISGGWDHGLQYYQRALELGEKFKTELGIKELEGGEEMQWLASKQAEAHRNLGHIYKQRSKWLDAMENFNKCIEISKSIGNYHEIADAYRGLGYVHWRKGKYSKAIEYYDKCIENTEKIHDLSVMAVVFIELGNVYNDSGNWERGVEYYTKALEVLEKLGEYREMARAYNNLGDVYLKQESWEKAIEYFEKCRRICVKIKNQDMEAWALFNLGECYAKKGELDIAMKHCNRALELLVKIDDKIGIAEIYRNFGTIYRFKKDWDRSVEYYTKSVNLLEDLNVPYEIAYAYHDFGLMYKDKRDFEQAKRCLTKAQEIYKSIGAKRELEKLSKDLRGLS
jgi:predicted ATPase